MSSSSCIERLFWMPLAYAERLARKKKWLVVLMVVALGLLPYLTFFVLKTDHPASYVYPYNEIGHFHDKCDNSISKKRSNEQHLFHLTPSPFLDYDDTSSKATVIRLAFIVAARPNLMKVDPVIKEIERRSLNWHVDLIHTGQHFDRAMSSLLFEELGMKEPNVYLHVPRNVSLIMQHSKALAEFDIVFRRLQPHLVVVVGDVSSTVVAAIGANACSIPVAHLEAGLRSYDRNMPEELNRLIADQISQFYFVTTEEGFDALREEHVVDDVSLSKRSYFVGNPMIDSLFLSIDKALELKPWIDLGVTPGEYVLVTFHRADNVDNERGLSKIVSLIKEIAESFDVIFPLHPRTRSRMKSFGLADVFVQIPRVHTVDPLGYLEFTALEAMARLVLTDSGGVQEETTVLGVPCITVRENTERPLTLNYSNVLVPLSNRVDLVATALNILQDSRSKSSLETRLRHIKSLESDRDNLPRGWDGHSSVRIVDAIEDIFHGPKPGVRVLNRRVMIIPADYTAFFNMNDNAAYGGFLFVLAQCRVFCLELGYSVDVVSPYDIPQVSKQVDALNSVRLNDRVFTRVLKISDFVSDLTWKELPDYGVSYVMPKEFVKVVSVLNDIFSYDSIFMRFMTGGGSDTLVPNIVTMMPSSLAKRTVVTTNPFSFNVPSVQQFQKAGMHVGLMSVEEFPQGFGIPAAVNTVPELASKHGIVWTPPTIEHLTSVPRMYPSGKEHFTLCYLGAAQFDAVDLMWDDMIKGFAEARNSNPKLEFRLAVTGIERMKEEVSKLIEETEGITVVKGIPHDEALRWYNELYDVGIRGLRPETSRSDGPPAVSTKVLEMGATALPVILNPLPIHTRFLPSDYSAFWTYDDSVKSLSSVLLSLAADHSMYEQASKDILGLAAYYSDGFVAKYYKEFLRHLDSENSKTDRDHSNGHVLFVALDKVGLVDPNVMLTKYDNDVSSALSIVRFWLNSGFQVHFFSPFLQTDFENSIPGLHVIRPDKLGFDLGTRTKLAMSEAGVVELMDPCIFSKLLELLNEHFSYDIGLVNYVDPIKLNDRSFHLFKLGSDEPCPWPPEILSKSVLYIGQETKNEVHSFPYVVTPLMSMIPGGAKEDRALSLQSGLLTWVPHMAFPLETSTKLLKGSNVCVFTYYPVNKEVQSVLDAWNKDTRLLVVSNHSPGWKKILYHDNVDSLETHDYVEMHALINSGKCDLGLALSGMKQSVIEMATAGIPLIVPSDSSLAGFLPSDYTGLASSVPGDIYARAKKLLSDVDLYELCSRQVLASFSPFSENSLEPVFDELLEYLRGSKSVKEWKRLSGF